MKTGPFRVGDHRSGPLEHGDDSEAARGFFGCGNAVGLNPRNRLAQQPAQLSPGEG